MDKEKLMWNNDLRQVQKVRPIQYRGCNGTGLAIVLLLPRVAELGPDLKPVASLQFFTSTSYKYFIAHMKNSRTPLYHEE